MKKILFGFLWVLFIVPASAQQRHQFSLGAMDFLLDGKPLQLISGEIHPARVPKEYWRHRIQMAKAMGCNTIAAYIFWNYHETSPGVFDFKTGNRDIAGFVKICQEEKMWVLLRPGPYVCGEWDFGGLPPYLLKDPALKIRCMYPGYMLAVKRYIGRLAKEMRSLQCTQGGPVLMVQVENEYGSFGNDRTYMETLRQGWIDNGINVPFYTADGPTAFMLEAGSLEGAAIGLDSGGSEADFEQARKKNPGVPAFSSETYPGWLTHWGEKFARPDTNQLKREVEFLLKTKRSLNFYVLHGGTNFGYTAGANAFSPTQYQPDITSYDYDAPIDEQGRPTAKYFMLRRLIKQYVSYPVPEPPPAIPAIEIAPISMQQTSSIWQQLPVPQLSPQPQPMEYYDQAYGMILYSTQLVGHKSGKLIIWEPHDYALVFLDGKFIDTVCRDGGNWTVDLPPSESGNPNPNLEILVEGMGRINFAQFMIDRKGITDRVTLNGMTLMDWKIYNLPMDQLMMERGKARTAGISDDKKGIFFSGTFNLQVTGDVYFDLSLYKKGVVFVNGHNLGRFWYTGPQQRLYCPATWLKQGVNEIVVFDLLQQEAATIQGWRTME